MSKRRIPDYSIYAIIDRNVCAGYSLARIARDCIQAKIEIIQYRDKANDAAGFYKNALLIKKIIGTKVLFIVNDRADIARLVCSNGLHLGQSDIPVKAAKMIIGKGKVIGKSCHSLDQAMAAEREGVDYVSIGPIFATPTKPDCSPVGLELLAQVCARLEIPVVAIGGINKNNAALIRKTGAKIVAVVRAVCEEKNILKSVRQLRREAFYT